MIQEAAENGNGFGIDEFVTEKIFRQEIHDSHCFAIICKERCELLPIVHPSLRRQLRYVRSLIFPPLAGWKIFLGLFQATSS
jgi:hypothetical protein